MSRIARLSVRPRSAPCGSALSVCPHCWNVNRYAERLCGRCGADMTTVLQESGGLRLTAPVQSPVPVRVGRRLGLVQRLLLLGVLVVLALAQLASAFSPPAPRSSSAAAGSR